VTERELHFCNFLRLTRQDKLRCSFALPAENSTNKKTLKQAWRFFLMYYLFVTENHESSNLLENVMDDLKFYSSYRKDLKTLQPINRNILQYTHLVLLLNL
jgi:hypothetical protein